MAARVYRRALRLAAAFAGGTPELARYLGAEEKDVARWLAGTDKPPTEAFLSAVDLVLDSTSGPAPAKPRRPAR